MAPKAEELLETLVKEAQNGDKVHTDKSPFEALSQIDNEGVVIDVLKVNRSTEVMTVGVKLFGVLLGNYALIFKAGRREWLKIESV